MDVARSLSRWKSWFSHADRGDQPWATSGQKDSCAAGSQEEGAFLVQRVARNFKGRDFAVGDIHGCFGNLQRALDEIGFDPALDRLFSVGDLVDRGPESDLVLDWLDKPWFFAVCGNHDYMAWRTADNKPFKWLNHRQHGGAWMDSLNAEQCVAIGRRLKALPIALEVATACGWVGLVHASCPGNDWEAMHRIDRSQLGDLKSDAGQCLWSTQRAMVADTTRVRNIRAVVHGHITVGRHLVLGNVHFIDTGGWREQGFFTLLELDALKPAEPLPIRGR